MICGIDEAGRGPIAGPLVMAGVILKEEIEGLNDSKKLSEKNFFFNFNHWLKGVFTVPNGIKVMVNIKVLFGSNSLSW